MRRSRVVQLAGSRIELARTSVGTPVVRAADEIGLARATGYLHARDRGLQLLVLRLVGQGRTAQWLSGDPATVAVDVMARRADFAGDAAASVVALDPPSRRLVDAYGQGVAAGLGATGVPVELRLLGYRPAGWTPADTLLTVALTSWIGLAQTQAELEIAIVRAVAGGADPTRLRELFRPHLDGLDETMVGLLRRLTHVPAHLPTGGVAPIPVLAASNAWAVGGARSVSGAPLLAADPHLDIARLPALWYELIAHVAEAGPVARVGITMPGMPGMLMGRGPRLAWAFGYGYLDMVDLVVEQVRDGRVRRPAGWAPLRTERHLIARRGRAPVATWVHRSGAGVLEVPAETARVGDGLVLARAFSGGAPGPARSLTALLRLGQARSVREAQDAVAGAALSATWVFADAAGSIGLQQSGAAPRRGGLLQPAFSGLHPVRGWTGGGWTGGGWAGLREPSELVRITDPVGGLLVTANEARNKPNAPLLVNAPAGTYRRDRIGELLAQDHLLGLDDCAAAQADVHSGQAVLLLPVFADLASDTPAARVLAGWDCRYDPASQGATVFEAVYRWVLREVFGTALSGTGEWDPLATDTGILTAYFQRFDEVLADPDASWWRPGGRTAALLPLVRAALARFDGRPIPRWSGVNLLTQSHQLSAGRLPAWTGFDSGPLGLAGGRATVAQVQRVRGVGRPGVTGPSWRMVTDLAVSDAWTQLPGGASDRRWSRWYRNRMPGWLAHSYTRVDLDRTALDRG